MASCRWSDCWCWQVAGMRRDAEPSTWRDRRTCWRRVAWLRPAAHWLLTASTSATRHHSSSLYREPASTVYTRSTTSHRWCHRSFNIPPILPATFLQGSATNVMLVEWQLGTWINVILTFSYSGKLSSTLFSNMFVTFVHCSSFAVLTGAFRLVATICQTLNKKHYVITRINYY